MSKIKCAECRGDGIYTCNNPDHAFIENCLGWHEVGRLGCPACGHDEDHKIRNKTCENCKGTGFVEQQEKQS